MGAGRLILALGALAVVGVQPPAQQTVVYRVTFSEAVHHVADVHVTFAGLGHAPLQARMSRSSPGRYALHEFAKNVYDVKAADASGRELEMTRPNPYEWDVPRHGDAVTLTYKIFGDLVDGTYLAIDLTHAHMNLPATLMWARGLDDRPVRITFVPPPGVNWKPATQLYPTADEWTFTAPNLQYLFDSPTELSAYALRQFTVKNPDGKTYTIRTAVHTDAPAGDVDEYAAGVEKIVNEAAAVFGEFPDYETGRYTFLADYLPYDGGDGMEHRNSTVVTGRGSVKNALGTASHEFFHCWNVERIRPQGLEPFNFEQANMTDSLWLAEGFTQYYGQLILERTGLATPKSLASSLGYTIDAVVNGSGRQFRSPVDMSRMAPFVDAARSVDPTDFETTFISYYTYGSAVALGLDLTLRDRTNGKLTLDDFMRAMWRVHGKPGGPQPGLVGKPYSLRDVRDRIAEASGDRAFADDFFKRYIAGREVADYRRLLQRAGIVLRMRNPGAPWMGNLRPASGGVARIGALVEPGTPAYAAGLEEDDSITAMDGKSITSWQQIQERIAAHKVGDRVTIAFTRRSGPATTTVELREDPTLEAVMLEDTGVTPSADQLAFRSSWLGSQQNRRTREP
jgi:predicted metalloprotease with PDZ domain